MLLSKQFNKLCPISTDSATLIFRSSLNADLAFCAQSWIKSSVTPTNHFNKNNITLAVFI